jgi:hypothetical protein
MKTDDGSSQAGSGLSCAAHGGWQPTSRREMETDAEGDEDTQRDPFYESLNDAARVVEWVINGLPTL